MDERRKIVIPIGADSDSKSEQTFFDTQARKDARPVVPIPDGSATGPSLQGKRSRKRVLLVVIIVAAVAAAGTAGVYAYMSQGRGQDGTLVTVQPVAEKALSTLPWTHTRDKPDANKNEDATEQTNDANADDTNADDTQARNDGDPKKTSKQQKRDKAGDKNADDPIKRTQDELHRIREIFEGTP